MLVMCSVCEIDSCSNHHSGHVYLMVELGDLGKIRFDVLFNFI